LTGMVEGRLICADPADALEAVRTGGICLRNICPEGELELSFQADRRDWLALEELARRKGYLLKAIGKQGLYWELQSLAKRPVLVTGMAFLLALVLWLPTRVLFFQVEGNDTVPARMILEAAEDCGIRFGASRRQVRSEKMKNALLGKLPELQWAGINTSGCTAVISVRERQETIPEKKNMPGTIVAVRDGFITECTVTAGSPLCAPGQTVKADQTLISPYTDCGICIRVTGAKGEVFAQTRHKIRAVTPTNITLRLSEGSTSRRYSILLGKKRINLWKDSGISPATCGRMYAEYYLTLPGGFRLPAAICVETVTSWESGSADRDPEVMERSLKEFARDTVLGRMISGTVLQEDFQVAQEENLWVLEAGYVCTEMIGREIRGKIGEIHEQSS